MKYFSLGEFICPGCDQPHPTDVELCPATGQVLDAVHKMGGRLLDGRYRVREVVAEGGMGVIYRCEHRSMGSAMAVKFLSVAGLESREAYDRFLQEARLAAQVQHPGIVKTFDLGITQSGIPYIVMELLVGEDLGTRLETHGSLEIREALDITRMILEALAAVHAAGILHRDLKPENVFLARQSGGDEIVKILDFGISRLLAGQDVCGPGGQEHRVYGTPLYMSPEQIRADERVDDRADLWAVGVILYEMLTGRTPFQAAGLEELMGKVLRDRVQDPARLRPGLDPRLSALILRSLSKDVRARFGSAQAMLEALMALGGGEDETDQRESSRTGSQETSDRSSQYRIIRPSITEKVRGG